MTTPSEPNRRQAYALAALAEIRFLESRLDEQRKMFRAFAQSETVTSDDVDDLNLAIIAVDDAWDALNKAARLAWGCAADEVKEKECE